VADLGFFERVIAFAKRYDVLVLHDLAYSDVAFDGYEPPSFLQLPGAKDVGVEFSSLSKTYNMTGWRVGTLAGNPQLVDALARVKSNIDSGIPQAIQRMAIAALDGPQQAVADHNRIYQQRRDRVVEALRAIGLRATPPKASLYIWARIPEGETSIGFAGRLLDETGVVVTPGVGYGQAGEGYVRLSLTTPDEQIDEGLARLAAWSNGRAAAV
jgi:LL-diaminopimelate aminotransferase